MPSTTTVVVGAGHSGLAVSRELTSRSIDHVLLERGDVAQSWRAQRWDSLRLLTPNWQSRLPGLAYDGDDPDGFMSMPEVIAFMEQYASLTDAPVRTNAAVTRVGSDDGGFEIVTVDGVWRADTVVVASGACNLPGIPAFAEAVPPEVTQVHPLEYRNPDQLPDGGVLVVGASATGLQLAEEIHRSGRPVTLSVGEHVRMPRTYRGRDIQHWLDASGLLDERYDEVDDIVRARNVPSPQLVGTPERLTLDLNAVTRQGVQLRGRVGSVRDGELLFSGGLRNQCALADLKMNRMLNTIDEWVTESGLDVEAGDVERFEPTVVPDSPPLRLDLRSGEIATIVWATGFRPDYSWLDIPVLDRKGRIRHDGGVVTDVPGLYLIGTTFLRRRKSSFIHGAGDDAADITAHLAAHLDTAAVRR